MINAQSLSPTLLMKRVPTLTLFTKSAPLLCLLFSLMGVIGCEEDKKSSEVFMIRGGAEAGEMAGASTAGMMSMGGEMTTGGMSEAGEMAGAMGGDQAGTDSGRVRVIDNCEQLCGVYDICEASGESPWEDCLTGCALEDWEDLRFKSYVSCLRLADCSSLSTCSIPPPPLPSCEEACAVIDGCEAPFRLPMRLTQMGTCGSACQDSRWAQNISVCAQQVSPEICDQEPEFASCILNERGGECNEICAAQVQCDESIDLIECTLECLQEAPESDPLAERIRQNRRQCVTSAADCQGVADCLSPPPPPLSDGVDLACQVAEMCGVFEEGVCPEVMGEVARGLSSAGLSCLSEQLTDSCEATLIPCFAQGASVDQTVCNEYCLIASLCGGLEEGQSELDCADECGALVQEGASTFSAYTARVACNSAQSCDTFNACLSGAGTSDECVALCAQRVACGAEENADCLSRCNSRFSTERSRVERACGQVLTCEAFSDQCALSPVPACDERCAPLQGCDLAEITCVTECDNEAFIDEEAHLEQLSCVNSTARCDEIAECETDPLRGRACLAYCEREVNCGGDRDDREMCILSCARGDLEGDTASFELARDCLSGLDSSADCPTLDACFADQSLADLCTSYCATVEGCGFSSEDCLTECQATPSSLGDALGCVVNTTARSEGCSGAAECLGIPAPEPTPECARYCDGLKRCDPSVDLFFCHTDCLETPEGDLMRATCVDLVSCDDIDVCQTPENVPPLACADACTELDEACGGVAGEMGRFETLIDCTEVCGGIDLANGGEGAPLFADCLTEAMCETEALDACFSGTLTPAIDPLCERGWTIITQCNFQDLLMTTEDQFYLDCAEQIATDPAGQLALVECLEQVHMTDPTCFSALFSCPGIF